MDKVNLNALSQDCYSMAFSKGFYKDDPNLATKLMLIVSELSEVLEADRKGDLTKPSEKVPHYTNFEEEMADTIIRILDLAGRHNLNIHDAVLEKIRYNAGREKRHGKRY